MPNPPSPRTWIANEIPPYATVNAEVYNTVAFMLQPPMAKVRQTTTQSIPNNTFTAMQWQTEDTDPWNWHNQTDPTRLTPTYPGWYRGWFSVCFGNSTAGTYRASWVQKNGSVTRARRDLKPSPDGYTVRSSGVPFYIAMNGTTDYLEVIALQDTGGAVSTPVGSNTQSEFFVRWWCPL